MTESGLWFFKEYAGATKALAGTCYGVTTHPGMDFLGYVSKTPDDRHWCYDDGTHCGRFMAGEGSWAGSFRKRREAGEALRASVESRRAGSA